MAAEEKLKTAKIPELVTFEPKTRDIVISSIKLVLRRLRGKGMISHEGEYVDLLKNPDALHEFIQRFKENREVASDLAVDATGSPVTDDHQPLICNLTLAQIERLLVYTCAKKRLALLEADKNGQKGKAVSADLPDEIKAVLAFAWQLPLLDTYLDVMKPEHFRVLGRRVLALKDLNSLGPIARMDAHDVRKAEKLMKEDFDTALQQRPNAIRGAAVCHPKNYQLLKRAAQGFVWQALSAEPQVVLELSGMSREQIAAIAPHAGKMCWDTFQQLEAVPEPLLPPLMEGFGSVFGADATELLGEPEFAKKYLFKMVGAMRSISVVNDEQQARAAQAARYKWDAVRDEVLDWLSTRQQR